MGMTNCPIECPNRRVGCRTGCPVWEQHEAEKAISYAERVKNNEFKEYKGREGRTEMNRLKERRLELGLTQEAVSGVLKLVDPRIDTCMVSRFENGVCLPTEEVLTALEAALRTNRAYLYGDEDKADIPRRTAETERIAALIPHGRRNAISRAELAAAMQTSDRMMRKAVSEAKRQGVMICNDGEGYYQTEELGDLYRQYRRDTARAMSILKARKPMRDVLKAAGRPV